MLATLTHSALSTPLAAPQADFGRVRWAVSDAGSGWSPRGVAVGDSGSAVFTSVHSGQTGFRLFPAGSSEPVIIDMPSIGLVTLQSAVALADSAPVAVSISSHATYASNQNPGIVAVVRAYDVAGDGQVLWERRLPMSDSSTKPGIAVSDGGEVIMAWWSVEALGGLLVKSWNADGDLLSRMIIPNPNGILFADEVELSRDGSIAMISVPLVGQTLIYDVLAGRVKASVLDVGTFTGSALSADGGRFATVNWQSMVGYRLKVFEFDADGHAVHIFERVFPDSVRVPAVAFDFDGSRIAYSVQDINPADSLNIVLHDVDADVQLFQRRFSAPQTNLDLWVVALELDDAGETLACANWGDSLNTTSEILVRDDQGQLLLGVDSRGSCMYIDLSPDGESLIAASRKSHATSFSSPGGDFFMIETRARDLRLEGTPGLGHSLGLSIVANPVFDSAAVVMASELLPASAGRLRLDISSRHRVLGVLPLQFGTASTSLPIPKATPLIGALFHFQAVLFDDGSGRRRMTNKVSLRITP